MTWEVGALVWSPTSVVLDGYTAGSVLFAGAGGVAGQNNSNFKWTDTALTLQIGPLNGTQSNLFVDAANSAVYVNSATFRTNDGAATLGSGGGLQFGIGDAGFLSYTPMASINGSLVNATGTELQGDLIFKTRSNGTAGQTLTERIRISNGGNIGIGNSNPQALLSIGTTAAAARSYNSFTDASNGEWAYMGDWSTSNVATYGTDKNGTGSARNAQIVIGGVLNTTFGSNAVIINSMPTSDPHVVGQLYNTLGIVHISAG